MKCQILFLEKNKKNINLSSVENAQRVVKIKHSLLFRGLFGLVLCNLKGNVKIFLSLLSIGVYS